MPRLCFRPKPFNGIFLAGFSLFLAIWAIVALDSFWSAVPFLVPLLILAFLCAAVFLNAYQQKITLNDDGIYLRDGQTEIAVRYNQIENISVSRGEAFDGQPQIYLRLMRYDREESLSWNISDFGLQRSVRCAMAIAGRANLALISVTLHMGREEELRKMTRKLGALTLLPQPDAGEEKSKNWFVTFALSPNH